MQHTLIAEKLYKIIDKKEVLYDVSLNLKGGRIYGFTGENGA